MNFLISESMPPIEGGHLFNNAEFHSLKLQNGNYYSCGTDEKTVARIAFYLDDKSAVSGFQAPFGSLDAIPGCTIKEQLDLLTFCIDDLKSHGIETVTVNQPPGFLSTTIETEEVLKQLGFIEEYSEVNQHLFVDNQPFYNKVTRRERNKLNRAVAKEYAMKLLGIDDIALAYQLIEATYLRKGYPVTMTEAELKLAFQTLPEKYFLFGLYDKTELIAAIASVRVSDQMLYNFFHADLEHYRSVSPLVMLIGSVYEYCSDNGIKFFDLGISSVKGEANEGLFRFKENLGSLVSSKKTFNLEL